ncbi:MAG TPA: hypothetical protein VGR60_09750 [Gemmatimonadales bacterium]|nr:hypothetical protein [Gemmatimonadales bacterium]
MRLLAFLLLLGSPGIAAPVSGLAHRCQAARTGMSDSMPTMAHLAASGAAVGEVSHHQCDHCPPSECTSITACAPGSAAAVTPESAVAGAAAGGAGAVVGAEPRLRSTSREVLTPPPQRILVAPVA